MAAGHKDQKCAGEKRVNMQASKEKKNEVVAGINAVLIGQVFWNANGRKGRHDGGFSRPKSRRSKNRKKRMRNARKKTQHPAKPRVYHGRREWGKEGKKRRGPSQGTTAPQKTQTEISRGPKKDKRKRARKRKRSRVGLRGPYGGNGGIRRGIRKKNRPVSGGIAPPGGPT